MIEQLLKSIALALKSKYDAKVHVDELAQGMNDGDFFILPLDCVRERLNGSVWRNTYNIDIHLFEPSRMQGLKKAEDIKKLLEWVTFIEDGIVIHGTDIYSTYLEGIEHIFVTYVIDERAVANGSKMEDMVYERSLK